jgi:hypothetical protein
MAAFRTDRFGGLSKLYKDAKATTGFVVYSAENRTAVARLADPKDLLSNPNAAVQAANAEAFRAWQATLGGNSRIVKSEVWVEIPEHTYEPASAPKATGVSSASVTVAAGKGAAFDSSRRDFVKFRQKVGYPYPVRAYRVVIGEARNVYVTHYDSREKLFGANALAALVEKAGAGAEWQALGARLTGAMGPGWTTTLWNFNEALSYTP